MFTMLQLRQALINKPILSLRTSGRVALATDIIINPNNLKIEGWYCQDSFRKNKKLILQTKDIRDVIPQGIVVNDHDSLSEPDELVRLQEIIKLNFELLGKQVVTTGGQKLGKVNDFAADSQSMYIQKLYVGQSLLKNLSGNSLSIDRSQIVEITSRKIVVNEPTITQESAVPAIAPAAN